MSDLCLKTKIIFDLYEYLYSHIGFNYKITIYNPIQLKNGSIVIYSASNISILDKKLSSNKIKSFYDEENEKEEELPIISNIKQIKNGKLLCCAKDLFILEIKLKNIINSKKIILSDDETIFDIVELKNGKILGITNKSLVEIINKNKNYEISQIFKIPDNWFITPNSKKMRFFSNFRQYMDLYELPNNRLLIHSHSTELSHNGGCGTHPPSEIYENKIYSINLENFEIIHCYEEYDSEINIVILDKYICISNCYKRSWNNIIDIYSINDFKLIKKIKDKFEANYIIKYNENIIIGISKKENKNNIIAYNLSNLEDIKYKLFKADFIKFKKKYYNSIYEVRYNKNKSICILKNGSILIICHGLILIVDFPGLLPLLPFISLNQIKS